jgi:hypothetical protein
MSRTESCKAVGEATDRRAPTARATALDPAGLPRGEAVAHGVLPASVAGARARCLGDRRKTDEVARYLRWGFRKLCDRLRVDGRPWNHKRVHRVSCPLRLLPRQTTRRVPRRIRQPLTGRAETDMGARLSGGDAVRQLPRAAAESHRRKQQRRPGDRHGRVAPSRRVVGILNELIPA